MEQTGIIPVIKLEKTENAVKLAKALSAGGIKAAEVTFRAAGADKVIADMVKACPEMLVGAGTVPVSYTHLQPTRLLVVSRMPSSA